MPTPRRRLERTKPCGCTGVRWCAACRDPRVRETHGMDDPVILPDFLRTPPNSGVVSCVPSARVFWFDPRSQSVPGCPDFSGVQLFLDFVSEQQADRLLDAIESAPFAPAQSGKQKQHYGAKVNFNKKKVNAAAFEGLPGYAGWLESRLRQWLGRAGTKGSSGSGDRPLARAIEAFRAMDVFVLRYRAEDQSNLDFHIDDVFAYGEAILDLSLETDAVLTFLREGPAEGQAASWECVRIPVPARSMLVLYGPARYEWEHAILSYDVRGQRTSITLRTLSEELRRTDAGRQVEGLAQRRLECEWVDFGDEMLRA